MEGIGQLVQAMGSLSVAEKEAERKRKAYAKLTPEQRAAKNKANTERARLRREAKRAGAGAGAEPAVTGRVTARRAEATKEEVALTTNGYLEVEFNGKDYLIDPKTRFIYEPDGRKLGAPETHPVPAYVAPAPKPEPKPKRKSKPKTPPPEEDSDEEEESADEEATAAYRRSEELRKERLTAEEKRKREEVPPAEVPTLGGEKPSSVKELLNRLAEKGWVVKTVRVNKNPVPPGAGAKRFGKTVGGYYSGYAFNSPANIDAEHEAPLLVAPDGKTAWDIPDATFTSKRKYRFVPLNHPSAPYALWTEDRYIETFPRGTVAGYASDLPDHDHFTLKWSRDPSDDKFTTTLS